MNIPMANYTKVTVATAAATHSASTFTTPTLTPPPPSPPPDLCAVVEAMVRPCPVRVGSRHVPSRAPHVEPYPRWDVAAYKWAQANDGVNGGDLGSVRKLWP